MGITLSSRGNRGKTLESIVELSQRGVVRVVKMGAEAKFLGGGAISPRKGPVDYVGTVVGTGRSICFDAKQSAQKYGLRTDQSHIPSHQRDFLIDQGRAGAISGLIVLRSRENQVLWLDWKYLWSSITRGVIRWDDMNLVPVNEPRSPMIDFRRIPGVVP